MRVIDAELGAVRAVAISPDGRFVAASGDAAFAVFDWATGNPLTNPGTPGRSDQVAFGPAGAWAVRVSRERLHFSEFGPPPTGPRDPSLRFAGGLAVSPDGRTLVAASAAPAGQAKLERWSLPGLKPLSGFDFWSPFRRLAYSPDGELLAGIWPSGFELRFAASGGLDYRHRMPRDRWFRSPGFVSFDRGTGLCAFGWEGEFHVLDVSTGTSKAGPRVEAAFRDAAFSPGADLFATVGDDGRLKLWDPGAWAVAREYDWGCGPLTAVAFTADGSAGVCGTADGRLVQFDVDV